MKSYKRLLPIMIIIVALTFLGSSCESDPVVGSEQGRIRPALVIQNDLLNKLSPLTIVAPITSRIYSKEFPTNVFLSKKDSQLDKDSTILLNQLRTIDTSRLIKYSSSELIFLINLEVSIVLN